MAEIERCRHVSINVELSYLCLSLMTPRETASPTGSAGQRRKGLKGVNRLSSWSQTCPRGCSLEHGYGGHAMAMIMSKIILDHNVYDRSPSSQLQQNLAWALLDFNFLDSPPAMTLA